MQLPLEMTISSRLCNSENNCCHCDSRRTLNLQNKNMNKKTENEPGGSNQQLSSQIKLFLFLSPLPLCYGVLFIALCR